MVVVVMMMTVITIVKTTDFLFIAIKMKVLIIRTNP